MAFAHGRLTYFKLATADLSAWVDNTDFPQEADLHETTTYGKSAKTFAPGLKNATFSVGGLYDAATGGPEAIIRPLVGAAAVAFEFGPESNTPTKPKFTGSCLVKNYKTSHPVGDMVRWTADIQVTDTVTIGAFA